MKSSIVCGVVVATALMVVSHVASAEVAGLKSDAECKKLVSSIADLTKALSNLTPQNAVDYFDATNNRFVFCMDASLAVVPKITNPTEIANNSSYPIVIKDLVVDGAKKDPNGNYIVPTGTTIITITQGTGEIALQNLKADNLRAPILLQGKATLLDSTVSCDAANTAPGITVRSNYNTLRNVSVKECGSGVGVTGSRNAFYNVMITKTAADETQLGAWGVTVTNPKITAMQVAEGTVGAFKNAEGAWGLPSVIKGFTKDVAAMDGTTIKEPVNNSIGVYFKASGTLDYSTVDGFAFGVAVEANNIKIRNNLALGGSQGAVVIANDPMTKMAYQPVTGINC